MNKNRPLRAFIFGALHILAHIVPHAPRMTVLLFHSISDEPDFFAVRPKGFGGSGELPRREESVSLDR